MSGLLDSFAMPGLLLRDFRLMLRYERDRAEDTFQALRCWCRGLWVRVRRMTRLQGQDFSTLLRLELRCANEGLIFPTQGPGQAAPWHLSEEWLTSGPEALPAHPLIDRAWWLASLPPVTQPRTAVEFLEMLHDDAERRWSQLPRFVVRSPPPKARLAVCLHLYYPELWPEIRDALSQLTNAWDLFVSVPRFAATPTLHQIAEDFPTVRFMPLPNRGRDVLPWLHLLDAGAFDGYEWVCKLHTKNSPHMRNGAHWRKQLFDSLLGSAAVRASLLVDQPPMNRTGIAGPADALVLLGDRRSSAACRPALRRTKRMLHWPADDQDTPFFAGTMFWFRPAALRALGVIASHAHMFPVEAGQTDGTPAHAVERLVGLCAQRQGFLVSPLP